MATPRVSAGVIFTDDESRVLMLRTTYKDYWEIPVGYVEPGESPHAAAAREGREELGRDVPIGRMLAASDPLCWRVFRRTWSTVRLRTRGQAGDYGAP